MKILITGSNGFVGKNLVTYYQERYEGVYCPKRQELNLLDSTAIEAYLTQHQFDVVIHCAVTTTSVEQNLQMYFGMERCASSFGKMICVGSGAEYDMKHYIPAMSEDYFDRFMPSDIYGFSKYVMGKDIERVSRNLINLRVFGIYGKHENYKRRFISNNICRVLSGLDISINKNMFFDYLYITDFLRISEFFVKQESAHRTYNICTGTRIDLLSLAKIIREVDGNRHTITVKEEGENPEYSGCNDRFLKEFGPFEFTPHASAIAELYDWYKNSSGLSFDAKEFA